MIFDADDLEEFENLILFDEEDGEEDFEEVTAVFDLDHTNGNDD